MLNGAIVVVALVDPKTKDIQEKMGAPWGGTICDEVPEVKSFVQVSVEVVVVGVSVQVSVVEMTEDSLDEIDEMMDDTDDMMFVVLDVDKETAVLLVGMEDGPQAILAVGTVCHEHLGFAYPGFVRL